MKETKYNENEYILFTDLLKKIKNNEIITTNLKIEDSLGVKWIYNNIANQFTNQNDRLLSYYNDLELLFLYVKILPKDIKTNIAEEKAIKEIILELEDMYENIDQYLDSCQGCTDNLDVYFAKLNLYKNIVEYIGGDIDKDKQAMVDRFWKKALEEQKIEQDIDKRKDAIIKPIPVPLDLLLSDEKINKAVIDLYIKVNDICNLLRKNYELFEKYKN